MSKPSAETQLRTVKRLLSEERERRIRMKNDKAAIQRKATHMTMVLQAISEGKYPGDLAVIAATHALSAVRI